MSNADDEPTCAGCGIPLSLDEVYARADCSDWWEMTGVEVSEKPRSESDE